MDTWFPVAANGAVMIKGFEVMRMFKKEQFRLWIKVVGSGSEAIVVCRVLTLCA
jgi:hypothetical protein